MNALSLACMNEISTVNHQHHQPRHDRAVSDMYRYKKMLIDALEHDEFQLVYQPQTDMSGHRVIGVEALLRWHSAEHGNISPAVFIPAAEKLGLISPIGEMVIQKASAQLADWKKQYKSQLRMAINVSYMQMHSQKILETFDQCMSEFGLSKGELEVELTESTLVRDEEYVIDILNEIRQMGIRTAIDDFGTGYSSLSHLARMPFDTLKIDRSFISQIGLNQASTTITESIINMAKNLGMEVLGEGVETEEQQRFLLNKECDLLQGNLISQPLAADKVPQMIGMTLS